MHPLYTKAAPLTQVAIDSAIARVILKGADSEEVPF